MYNIKYEDNTIWKKKITARVGAYLSPISHAVVSSTLPTLAFYIWE